MSRIVPTSLSRAALLNRSSLQIPLSHYMTAITLNLDPIIHLTDEQFYQLCQTNREVKFERTAKGELIVMPPVGGETGKKNVDISGQLWLWNRQQNLGVAFDSSTGFKLPNGADRSPDAAWVKLERWEALTQQQRHGRMKKRRLPWKKIK